MKTYKAVAMSQPLFSDFFTTSQNFVWAMGGCCVSRRQETYDWAIVMRLHLVASLEL